MKSMTMCVVALLGCMALNSGTSISASYADPGEMLFEKDRRYDIYYALSEQEGLIQTDVKVLGTMTQDDVVFLQVEPSGLSSVKGYILLSAVRAIFPSGTNRSQSIK